MQARSTLGGGRMGTWQATNMRTTGTWARHLAQRAAARARRGLRSTWALTQRLTLARLPRP